MTARAVLLPVDDGRLWRRAMAENEGLERVVRIEKKLDALSVSVDERFKEVDKRFDEVRDHFVEQREYTEFAYDRLNRRISEGLARLEQRMSEGFAASDQRMDKFDQRMDGFDQRMDKFDQRLADGFAALDQRITSVKEDLTDGLSRVERKLDQFIESQSRSKKTRRAQPSKRRR